MDNFDDDENEIMDAEDQEIANEEIDEDLMKISMMNAAAAADHELSADSDEDEENNNGTDRKDVEKCSDDNKEKTTRNLPAPFMFPFSHFLPSNSNVILEPMNATRAAVAQFAENNLAPAEVALLHSTLYNLQQQQILQLQLIQQLQLQVNMGGNPTQCSLPFLPPVLASQSSSQEFNNHKPQSTSKLEEEEEEDNVQDLSSKEEKLEKNPEASESEGTESKPTTITTTASSTSIIPPNPSPLPLSGKDILSSVPPPTSEFAKLTKLVERSQYVSDDPFFRHKCRLCQKVFGSDSALQIHIRSHTGERPFKCNICGNRFTTRGNLKVHFERHKAKYPHVKMNPHPVPEHLDKIPSMPLIGSPFPSTPTPPLPLSGGIFSSAPPMSISSMMSSIYSNSMFGPRPTPRFPPAPSVSEEQSSSSASSSSSLPQICPTPTASEAPVRKSPVITDMAVTAPVSSAVKREASSPIETQSKMSRPSSQFPLLSPVPSVPPPPPLTPTSGGYSSRDSILPTKMIDHDENLEQYMEIDRSETSKLQQLVDNLENKVSDPNQCVICHRVLSCKSALQMHYRIHTGERPYKCKICGRAFTTKGNLKTHMGVHRMKPPIRMMHQCPVCHKSFTNLLVLQQHIRSHASLPGMPPMPDMSHFKAFGNFPRPMEWGHRPFDLSFRHEPERELDLSKTSPTYQLQRSKGYEYEVEDRDLSRDMDDVYSDEQQIRNEGEAIQNGEVHMDETNEDGRDGDNKKDHTKDRPARPESTKSDASKGSGRSASPNTEDESNSLFLPTSNLSPGIGMGAMPLYNTSLAALEERVRAIDSSMASHRYNPFGLNGYPHIQMEKKNLDDNGDLSDSEEHGSADDSKPGTPALSVNSEGSNSINGFMMGGDKLSTTCNICFKTFACRSALDIHYRSHTKERPYKCEVCDRTFTTKGNMKQHMLTHKIRDLPNSFSNNSNSSENLENDENSNDSITEEKKPEDQPRLQASSKVSESSNQERQAIAPAVSSSGGSNYTSNGGGTSNGSQDSSPFLRRTPLKHQCQVCQKGFSSASALQIHIRTHTGDKPFKCNVCGKAFTTKGNLKVHMGTHMWNNSPSRRGRRMSIEPPFMMTHKENPYMQGGFPPRAPDFFPYQFPPFMNGVPHHKINEMSVIQSLASGMGHMPHLPLKDDHLTSRAKVTETESKAESWRKSDSNGNLTSSGELDLSMKSNSSTSPNNNGKPSPSPGDNWNSAWKTMCHLCNQNFPSPTTLEYHMQNYHLKGSESHPKSIVA
ncbi:homeotic protein spalt-major-like isoform X3 [Ostrea edulis]|nr:homeotic protein spalt-major-like isoform X3 [Ostrea edulis]